MDFVHWINLKLICCISHINYPAPFDAGDMCDLTLCLLADKCSDHTHRNAEAVFSSQVSEKRSHKNGSYLDLLKSVTVSESSTPWKLLIHHRLVSLALLLWPWAINSITDVLQEQRLNNYTVELRESDVQHKRLDVASKMGINTVCHYNIDTPTSLIPCGVKPKCGWWLCWVWGESQTIWLRMYRIQHSLSWLYKINLLKMELYSFCLWDKYTISYNLTQLLRVATYCFHKKENVEISCYNNKLVCNRKCFLCYWDTDVK